VNYAIQNHRINPASLDYVSAGIIPEEKMQNVKEAMEEIDGLAAKFSFCKSYESPEHLKKFVREFLDSASLNIVKNS